VIGTHLIERLAALTQWHITQGFPAPTKTTTARQMVRGIRALHPTQEKQAAPLLLLHLEQAVNWLDREAALAAERHDFRSAMKHRRDIALVLIGFWRGFRGTGWHVCRLNTPRQNRGQGSRSTYLTPKAIDSTSERHSKHQPLKSYA
jgi:hypothetical protein